MKITERGWAGHFICANRCRFRRNTLIEGAGRRIVVSTVGGFFTDEGLQQIGPNRYYETMAFAAKDDGGYVEADVSEPLDIEGTCGIYAERHEELPDHVDDYANLIHDKAVAEFVAQLSFATLAGEAVCTCSAEYKSRSLKDPACNHDISESVDIIRAHLAGMGEPVAEIRQSVTGQIYIGFYNGKDTSDFVGAKFYLAPPASGDWDKVRSAIASLEAIREESPDTYLKMALDGVGDKLTAALPGGV